MKKLIILLPFVLLLFSSCKKYFDCTCTTAVSVNNSISTTVSRYTYYDTRSGATTKCNAAVPNVPGESTTCSIKSDWMKILIILIILVSLSSCKKYYGCTCTSVASIVGVSKQGTDSAYTIKTINRQSYFDTKSNATSKCNALILNTSSVTTSCTVVSN